jgi:hypothetical protein
VHIHQFDGSDRLFYYACAGDGTNTTCSSVRTETLLAGDVTALPAADTSIELVIHEGVCPTDSLANILLYLFVLLMVIGFAVWASYSSILFFSIIVGFLGMIVAFPMYACNPIYGLLLTLASVFYIAYEAFFRKFQRED